MSKILLYCPELGHVGPGSQKDGQEIWFHGGWAELDDTAPDFGKRMSWINGPGCPLIQVKTEAERDAINALGAMSDAEFERVQFLRTGR